MKRLFPLLLIFTLLVLSACGEPSVPTVTEGEKDNGTFRYYLASDHAEILKYVGTETAVTVPDTLDGQPVTVIGNAAFTGGDVVSVHLPDSVTEICDNAFDGCNFMTEWNAPASLERIGVSAFNECSALTELSFPATLKELSPYAFSMCLALEKVTFAGHIAAIPDNCFSYCSLLSEVNFTDGAPETIDENAFLDCPVAGTFSTQVPTIDLSDLLTDLTSDNVVVWE